jgi:hypothetical protein
MGGYWADKWCNVTHQISASRKDKVLVKTAGSSLIQNGLSTAPLRRVTVPPKKLFSTTNVVVAAAQRGIGTGRIDKQQHADTTECQNLSAHRLPLRCVAHRTRKV